MTTAGYEQKFFATADGLRVSYRDYRPAGPANGPTVLCLHGLTRNARDFEDVAPQIAASGRRVIVAEQRGRGLSDPDPIPARYSPPIYAIDMLGLLRSEGVDRVVIIGTSMGGLVAMFMALRPTGLGRAVLTFSKSRVLAALIARKLPALRAPGAAQLIAGVALNDVGPVLSDEGLRRIQAYVGEDMAVASWEEAETATREAEQRNFPNEDDPAFWTRFTRRLWREAEDGSIRRDYDPRIADNVRAAQPGQAYWWLFDALASTPTLLVRGALSDLLTTETAAAMRARKSDLAVIEAANVGHAPMLTEPDIWLELKRFVQNAR